MTETELWAVHIEGPDSMLAMPSKEEAEKRADELNAGYAQYASKPGRQAERLAKWHAVVVPWPGTAEGHAEELADEEGPDW
jgi:hypothetical protein